MRWGVRCQGSKEAVLAIGRLAQGMAGRKAKAVTAEELGRGSIWKPPSTEAHYKFGKNSIQGSTLGIGSETAACQQCRTLRPTKHTGACTTSCYRPHQPSKFYSLSLEIRSWTIKPF